MEQRVSLVTLGVRDLARAHAFYEGLGWKPPAVYAASLTPKAKKTTIRLS